MARKDDKNLSTWITPEQDAKLCNLEAQLTLATKKRITTSDIVRRGLTLIIDGIYIEPHSGEAFIIKKIPADKVKEMQHRSNDNSLLSVVDEIKKQIDITNMSIPYKYRDGDYFHDCYGNQVVYHDKRFAYDLSLYGKTMVEEPENCKIEYALINVIDIGLKTFKLWDKKFSYMITDDLDPKFNSFEDEYISKYADVVFLNEFVYDYIGIGYGAYMFLDTHEENDFGISINNLGTVYVELFTDEFLKANPGALSQGKFVTRS